MGRVAPLHERERREYAVIQRRSLIANIDLVPVQVGGRRHRWGEPVFILDFQWTRTSDPGVGVETKKLS